jgi:hypothetical protein
MSVRPGKPERSEPLAAAVNWSGLAAFLGVPVDEVRSLALAPEEPSGPAERSSDEPPSR